MGEEDTYNCVTECPILANGRFCTNSCPNGTFISITGTECVEHCDYSYVLEDEEVLRCIEECEEDYAFSIDGYDDTVPRCSQNCSDFINGNNLMYGRECVNKCPPDKPYN